MSKPRGLQWLEDQTGEEIPYTTEPAARGRHLSVRVDGPLGARIEAAAAARGLAVSEYVREALAAAVDSDLSARTVDSVGLIRRIEGDLAEVRRRLAG